MDALYWFTIHTHSLSRFHSERNICTGVIGARLSKITQDYKLQQLRHFKD